MNKRHLFALIAAGFLFGGCEARDVENGEAVDQRQQKGIGWNGIGWNGIGWNGIGWNGIGWNGIGWNGIGWNGIGWNGIGWNGAPPDWDLDYFVNATDLDGDTVLTSADREAALMGLAYWTGCACPSGTSPTWYGWNPYLGVYETRTFSGNYGLAPTWCTGLGVVPPSEHEAVSACLIGSINTKGKHVALSMRGAENSLKLVDNEKLFMSFASEQYWGNLWDNAPGTEFYDTTDGNFYPKSKAYACYFPWGGGNWQLAKDLQTISGRTCAWDGCGGPVKTSRACLQPGNIDGAYSTGHDPGSNPVLTADPAVGWGGLNNGPSNLYQDIVTGTEKADWRGNQWRRLSTFLGAWADLEVENWKPAGYQCSDSCAPSDGCSCYKNYCASHAEGEGQSLLCERPSECNNCATVVRQPAASCGTSAACADGDCVRDRKLTLLKIGCWLQVDFLRPYDLLTGSYVSGNANTHKSGTLAFRYSNGSGVNASILIRDRIRNSMIPGIGFAPTANWDDYDLKTIYPIYPGRTTFSGTTPAIEIEISGDPGSPSFPHLDYAQLWIGAPYGVQPRELYWEDKKLPIGKVQVCSTITVDPTTDFTTAGRVRFRPRVRGIDLSALQITLVRNGQSVNFQADPQDPTWSRFTTQFQREVPYMNNWQVCVRSSGPSGTLDGSDLEMEKQ